MFPSSEHPYSVCRNFIGVQRAVVLAAKGQKVAELFLMGYEVDATRELDELSERLAKWGDDAPRI